MTESISQREQELISEIFDRREELRKLKGRQITLCGCCYHRHDKDWNTHTKKSPNCHRSSYPCPTKVYARGVIFDEDGNANIRWDLQ